jgi:uncharacterized transporter YbjL
VQEAVMLFFALWIISGVLIIAYILLLAGKNELTQATIGNFWGPLIVGIIIGRNIVNWHRKESTQKQLSTSHENR